MIIQNPTHSIDAKLFQAVAIECSSRLKTDYYTDLYYVAIHVHRIFKNWNGADDLQFWLIVRFKSCHLFNEWGIFEVKRRHLYNETDSPLYCFSITLSRNSEGWGLSIDRLNPKTGVADN